MPIIQWSISLYWLFGVIFQCYCSEARWTPTDFLPWELSCLDYKDKGTCQNERRNLCISLIYDSLLTFERRLVRHTQPVIYQIIQNLSWQTFTFTFCRCSPTDFLCTIPVHKLVGTPIWTTKWDVYFCTVWHVVNEGKEVIDDESGINDILCGEELYPWGYTLSAEVVAFVPRNGWCLTSDLWVFNTCFVNVSVSILPYMVIAPSSATSYCSWNTRLSNARSVSAWTLSMWLITMPRSNRRLPSVSLSDIRSLQHLH